MAGINNLKPKKILIVKPSSLGDIIHCLPFLNSISKCYPEAEIHWVVARGLEGLLEGHPMVKRIWIINKDQWKNLIKAPSTIREIRNLFASLKRQHYDLAVDMQGLLRSGMIMSASKAPVRVGFKESQEGSLFFYTHTVGGRMANHAVKSSLLIAERLGCDASKAEFPMVEKEFDIPVDGDYAVLVPGARWKTKRWPAEKFGRLAARLPVPSLVVGGKGDALTAKAVVAASRGKATSIVGATDLPQLAYVMKRARFVVCNDSGPMHIAAAAGVPVVAIFGPSDPSITGPYGKGHVIVSRNEKCAPCHKKRCRDIKCMEKIMVTQVMEAVDTGVLSRKP